VHAILLTGGSAFGLDATGGVMRWLEEHGHGVAVGPARVPIVPAAVLFDLWVGDARIRPDAAAGHAACEAASTDHPAQGSVGAGAGASVGKLFGIERAMKGGIGTASLKVGAITVGALVAVNAIGDVVDPATGRVIAGARADDGRTPLDILAAIIDGQMPAHLLNGMATTIGIVATDAQLTKAQANKLAASAHDGLARTINPVHTATDGDAMFAVATGGSGKPGHMSALGALAAEVTARAVLNAVRAAQGLSDPPLPSARDLGLA
jgi:L-aminopeptidase/D-esterase-like protein